MESNLGKSVTAGDIAKALRAFRFIYSNEKQLQSGVARALASRGIAFEPEKDLGRDFGIVDFMVGRIAIEVKIKGSPSAVARQLIRYCGCPDVDEIILFTGRRRLGGLPRKLGGKKLRVLSIWATML